jgi:hypothetical protein
MVLSLLSKTFSLSPKAERIIFNIALVITIIAIIICLIGIAWYLQPSNVLTIYNEPIPTLKDKVIAGNTVIFKIEYCKHTNDVGKVNWYIVGNNAVTLLPSYTDTTQKSCGTVLDPIIIPPQLHPGMFYIVWQVTYPINPLKSDYTEFRSRDFNIIK